MNTILIFWPKDILSFSNISGISSISSFSFPYFLVVWPRGEKAETERERGVELPSSLQNRRGWFMAQVVQIPKEVEALIKAVGERCAYGLVRKWSRSALMRARAPYLGELKTLWGKINKIREEKNVLTNDEIKSLLKEVEEVRERMSKDKKVQKYSERVKKLSKEIKKYGVDGEDGEQIIPKALKPLGFDVLAVATQLAAKLDK